MRSCTQLQLELCFYGLLRCIREAVSFTIHTPTRIKSTNQPAGAAGTTVLITLNKTVLVLMLHGMPACVILDSMPPFHKQKRLKQQGQSALTYYPVRFPPLLLTSKAENSVCKVKYQRHISSLNRRGRRGAWVPITPFFVYVFRDLTMYVLEIHSSSLSSLPQTRVCSVVYISAKLSWRQPFTVFITQWGQ